MGVSGDGSYEVVEAAASEEVELTCPSRFLSIYLLVTRGQTPDPDAVGELAPAGFEYDLSLAADDLTVWWDGRSSRPGPPGRLGCAGAPSAPPSCGFLPLVFLGWRRRSRHRHE